MILNFWFGLWGADEDRCGDGSQSERPALPCDPGLSPTTSHLVHAAVDLLTCCELVMYVI